MSEPTLAKKTVLVVEDQVPLRTILCEALEKADISTLQAGDGAEGLSMALAHYPDLILLDLLMPRVGGMEMFKALRADPWGKSVSVIIITNVSDGEKIANAVMENVSGYLVKSDWKLEDMVMEVKNKLAGL